MRPKTVNNRDLAVTHKRVLTIAVPIVIANASTPVLGLVDTGVVGQLGEAAPIGAVAVGAAILSALYLMFSFLRMGTVGLAAQAFGASQFGEADAILSRALLVGFAGGALVILLQAQIAGLAFYVSPASQEVETLARAYFSIRVWSAPAAIASFGIIGWLIAQERTIAVLAIQVFTNGLNIILDLAFVLGLNWGVEGVAFATFIAEWSGLFLGLWLCRAAFGRAYWRNATLVLNRLGLRRMAGVNTDILIRTAMLQVIMVSFLLLGARYGDAPLAANQILLHLLFVTMHALDGFAFAAEAMVGSAFGAKRRSELRRSVVMTAQWGLGIVLVLSGIFALLGGQVIDVLTTADDVREVARQYLFWMVLVPIIGMPAWMLDGVFVGATRTRDMRNMMFVALCVYGLALLVLLPIFENHGLWAALLVSLMVRGLTLAIRYPALEASVRD